MKYILGANLYYIPELGALYKKKKERLGQYNSNNKLICGRYTSRSYNLHLSLSLPPSLSLSLMHACIHMHTHTHSTYTHTTASQIT